MKKQSAFTLIELLVVVGIIAILAMMATPNFLESQTRAKVSRVKSDMRSLSLALESYAVDHNKYPTRHNDWVDTETKQLAENPDSRSEIIKNYLPHYDRKPSEMKVLTTPIAYISSIPIDVFLEKSVPPGLNFLEYMDPMQSKAFAAYARWWKWGGRQFKYLPKVQGVQWLLLSVGPDKCINCHADGKPGDYPKQPAVYADRPHMVYDPTRGTISPGNIIRLSISSDDLATANFIGPVENPG